MFFGDAVILGVDVLRYLFGPCADPVERAAVLGADLFALGMDGLAVLIPGAPATGGPANLAGRGILVFGRAVPQWLRVVQIGTKGTQVITHLAQASGSGGSGGSNPQPLKGKVATKAAEDLGYTQRISPPKVPFDSHGQPAFRNPKTGQYITPDVDSHKGGVWKLFGRKGNRLGTYNADLTIRIGD